MSRQYVILNADEVSTVKVLEISFDNQLLY